MLHRHILKMHRDLQSLAKFKKEHRVALEMLWGPLNLFLISVNLVAPVLFTYWSLDYTLLNI